MLIVAIVVAAIVIISGIFVSIGCIRQVAFRPRSSKRASVRLDHLGPNMSWIAVNSNNTTSVRDALDLRNISFASWSDGIRSLYNPQQSDRSIFVTAPLNGWVLIAGHGLPQPLGASFVDKCTPLIVSLSEKFGEAQYFQSYPELDFFGWAKAVNGRLHRAYAIGDEGLLWNHGRLTAAENILGLKFFELRGIYERSGDVGGPIILTPTEMQVFSLAAQWSVNPATIGNQMSDTPMGGFICEAPPIWCSELLLRNVG